MPDPVQEYSKNSIYNGVEGYDYISILGVGITNGTINLDSWSPGPVNGAGESILAWNYDVITPHKFVFSEHDAWAPAQKLLFQISQDGNSIEVSKVATEVDGLVRGEDTPVARGFRRELTEEEKTSLTKENLGIIEEAKNKKDSA